ncbi:MAG: SpoIIIAC/SpoIIIAD family protein [Clostridia bacterium]|nr:SpoIIIAC/SpoIIIAD family protein [Clostridia bacterium]
MKILQILAISVVGVSFALLIRPYRPELAMITAIVTGLIALAYVMADMSGIIETLRALSASYGIDSEILGVLMKIVGVAFLAQIGAKICADAGESAIAAKVEICGRVLILGAAMPSLAATLQTASELLGALAP